METKVSFYCEMTTQAEVLKIVPNCKSKSGGIFDTILFKETGTGKSLKTYIYHTCRNRVRWEAVLRKGIGTRISNYILWRGQRGFIDADSLFKIA